MITKSDVDIESVTDLLKDLTGDRGVPRNIKDSIEDSIKMMDGNASGEEKIAHVISMLDEASSDPNISAHTRTLIWNTVSILERFNEK